MTGRTETGPERESGAAAGTDSGAESAPGTGAPPGGGGAEGAAQRMFAADRASAALGIELLAAADGAATLRMTVTDAMVNGHGTAHGGYLFLFADAAFACACNTHGPVTVASGADIDFIAPVRPGDTLLAIAEERTRFGRSGIYDVTLRRGDEVVAEFRGRSRTPRGGVS